MNANETKLMNTIQIYTDASDIQARAASSSGFSIVKCSHLSTGHNVQFCCKWTESLGDAVQYWEVIRPGNAMVEKLSHHLS